MKEAQKQNLKNGLVTLATAGVGKLTGPLLGKAEQAAVKKLEEGAVKKAARGVTPQGGRVFTQPSQLPAGSTLQLRAGVIEVVDAEGRVLGIIPQIAGGAPRMTQWGWERTNSWFAAVREVASGGEGGVLRKVRGLVPTYEEAVQLIQEAGGTIQRVDKPHAAGGVAGHIDFPHINFTTASGVRSHLAIQALPPAAP